MCARRAPRTATPHARPRCERETRGMADPPNSEAREFEARPSRLADQEFQAPLARRSRQEWTCRAHKISINGGA